MDIKDIEKAQKIVDQIKKIEAEMDKIQSIATLCSNGNTAIKLTLESRKKQPKNKKVKFDEDGSMYIAASSDLSSFHKMHSNFINVMLGRNPIDEDENDDHSLFSSTIEEKAALNVLGVLLSEYHQQRKDLVKQLEKLGITIRGQTTDH